MTPFRKFAWFLVGFTSATAIGAMLRSNPAAAQSPTLTQISPVQSRAAQPPRRSAKAVEPSDTDDALPPPTRAIARPARETDAVSDAEPQDADEQVRADAEPRRNTDGEPADGMERPLQDDGIVPVGEPINTAGDGMPPTTSDPRLKADIDAFETPAAGYDALAFQVELPDPILDRRPQRLARFEPYDPIGIRQGSWVIFPEVEVGFGGTSNIRRSPERESASFFDVRPTIRAVTNWRVHAVELRATGLASAYPGFAPENDRSYALEARARLDLSKRTSIEMLASHAQDQELRGGLAAVTDARERPMFTTDRAAVALNHRFNRLSVQLRGAITEVRYQATETLEGAPLPLNERNVTIRESAARATWRFKPTLFAFTEVGINDRTYQTAPSDGISRNSNGYRVVGGIGFGNTDQRLRGEIAIGTGRQNHEDSRLGDAMTGFIFEANLAYRPSALTSFLLTTRTDFNDATAVGQSGSISHHFNVEARHAFRRHLIGVAEIGYLVTDYSGTSVSEKTLRETIGLDYYLNRETTLFARLEHRDFSSSAPNADYTADVARVGLRWRP